MTRNYSRTLPACFLALFAGCRAAPPPATVARGPGSDEPARREVAGDWDDIDAAVRTALRRCQIAAERRTIHRVASDEGIEIVDYTLVTVRGDTGLLRLRGSLQRETIEISCRISAIGAPEAEACIVNELEARLAELFGRDFAPLRE
jgi:hypothetical protein